jgi:hypothetical protein
MTWHAIGFRPGGPDGPDQTHIRRRRAEFSRQTTRRRTSHMITIHYSNDVIEATNVSAAVAAPASILIPAPATNFSRPRPATSPLPPPPQAVPAPNQAPNGQITIATAPADLVEVEIADVMLAVPVPLIASVPAPLQEPQPEETRCWCFDTIFRAATIACSYILMPWSSTRRASLRRALGT